MRPPYTGKPLKNGGYWYTNPEKVDPKKLPPKEPETPPIDAEKILGECYTLTRAEWISRLADNLGVSRWSLVNLGFAWVPGNIIRRHMDWHGHGSWGIPMRNGAGVPVGVRLRTESGKKISIRGSREGIFIPNTGYSSTALTVEGPTDLAAALTLGYWGIGRPTCRGGIAHMQVAINRLRIRRVISIGDNDLPKWENEKSPGIEGAKTLAAELQVPVASLLLPTKDLRQFVNDGGTADVLDAMAAHLDWRYPKK